MTRARSLFLAAGAFCALSLALAGCAVAAEPAVSAPAEMETDAAWLDAGKLIGVVTWGSSNCPPMGGEATLAADGTVEITLVDPADEEPARACTADYAPRVTVVGAPEGMDAASGASLSIALGAAHGTATLAPLVDAGAPGTPTDYAPSAGWVGSSNSIAYLTWGSSTCPPVVQDVAVTAEGQATVTFVEPAPDRACTMDMAPRANLLAIEGFEPAPGAQLILTGDGFEAVAVPILGA